MLRATSGQIVNFRFGFLSENSYYDPISNSPPVDVVASVLRGLDGYGETIESTKSLLKTSYRITSINIVSASEITNPQNPNFGYAVVSYTFSQVHYFQNADKIIVYGANAICNGEYEICEIVNAYTVNARKKTSTPININGIDLSSNSVRITEKNNAYFKKVSSSEYNFTYTIPKIIESGYYTVIIQTANGSETKTIKHRFEVVSKNYFKTGKIIEKQLKDNIVTLKTDTPHYVEIGEYVSIKGIDPILEGTFQINSVPSDDILEFSHSSSQLIQLSSAFGSYSVKNTTGTSSELIGPTGGTSIAVRPIYAVMDQVDTNSILLIGHSDGIEINELYHISSVQEAINLLGADKQSPLLRGVFDAYSCGAKSIYIMCSARMSEYVSDVSKRLDVTPNLISENTSNPVNFYQKYYERLSVSYTTAKNFELIDIVVPLETSILGTGSVDFVTQLALHCHSFHENTNYVQMGIIGSRSNGIKESDIDILEANPIFAQKMTTYDADGVISSDIGRYVIPIYGELVFSHATFLSSYVSSAAAAFAGTMSSTPVYSGMIRAKIPGALSVFGTNFSRSGYLRLDNLGINTVYRTKRGQRGNPYEARFSNDYTMANRSSTLTKAPQMRLIAMLVSEINNISNDGIGKNSEEKVISQVENLLQLLLGTRVVKDYKLQTYASKTERGFLIFEINLVSSLGLKNINFSVTTGPRS